MSYRKQKFGQRFANMGDESESIFEDVKPLGKPYRYGWNRNADFRNMPPFVSNTPDYYTSLGMCVEVMGCSGDLFRAMKVTKWESLKDWNRQAPMFYFVWNRKMGEWVLLEHRDMQTLVTRSTRANRIKAFEVDGNEYYEMDWEWLKEKASGHGWYDASG